MSYFNYLYEYFLESKTKIPNRENYDPAKKYIQKFYFSLKGHVKKTDDKAIFFFKEGANTEKNVEKDSELFKEFKKLYGIKEKDNIKYKYLYVGILKDSKIKDIDSTIDFYLKKSGFSKKLGSIYIYESDSFLIKVWTRDNGNVKNIFSILVYK